MTALWTSEDVAAATQGTVQQPFRAHGVTFDSREVQSGDLFIALHGETADGHAFLANAIAAGAAGVLVERADAVSDSAAGCVVVGDTTAALRNLARAARERVDATIIGVTGSAGKTGTKEALATALDRSVPGHTHRSVKSYNNHTGVPLSLARMPQDTRFGVFEMGMNHSGELADLTRQVRPHIAIVTTIAPAHRAFFDSDADIADAKGEIFEGLEPGGTAIVPYDSPHRDRLIAKAESCGANVVTFGLQAGADVRALDWLPSDDGGTLITAQVHETTLCFQLNKTGEHWVSNTMAVLAAVRAAGGDLAAAGVALAELPAFPGRGARHTATLASGGHAIVIDESYNANPASMAATLRDMASTATGRKIAVLGAMRELGDGSDAYHAALVEPLTEAGVSHAVLVGPEMSALADALRNALEKTVRFDHVADAAAALDAVSRIITDGDTILVKGSNAIGLSRIVNNLVGGAG